MKKNELQSIKDKICGSANPKSVWILGAGVVVLAIFLCVAMFMSSGSSKITVPQAGAQQVAFMPNCPTGLQPAAFGQGQGVVRCPRCNFTYNDPNCLRNGASRCPRCQGVISMRGQGNRGFANVALVQPNGALPIFRDAVMPHAFRGVCENCHVVNPDIAIPLNTTNMPHAYRGVCSNCHTVVGL